MELSCTVHVANVDDRHVAGRGRLTIRKNESVYIPDMCRHRNPTVGFHSSSYDIGVVEMGHFSVGRAKDGRELKKRVTETISNPTPPTAFPAVSN